MDEMDAQMLAEDQTAPGARVSVWACPERHSPPLYRSDLVNGHHRNLHYGWTWWSAKHIVTLPVGMSFYDALCSTDPIEVTITHDVDPLESGLNEVHQRFEADWAKNRPEQRLLHSSDLQAVVGTVDINYFRTMRDIERRTLGWDRAVLRSDDYGRAPHHMLIHDWPDGMFAQGGKVNRDDVGMVFIEAFPREPATYFRGEGLTYTAAEDSLWARWQAYTACSQHEWETRGYRNGAGFCRQCGLFGSHVFDLVEIGSTCAVCKVGTYNTTVPARNPDGTWNRKEPADLLCEEHTYPHCWTLTDQLVAHDQDPTQPAPDLSWMAHRLPDRVPLSEVSMTVFREAHQQAVRDALDTLLAEQED